jgi:hypothetical protein
VVRLDNAEQRVDVGCRFEPQLAIEKIIGSSDDRAIVADTQSVGKGIEMQRRRRS